MLVDNYYENIILGSDYISCLMALIRKKREKSILFVEDHFVKNLEPWNNFLGPLEITTLKNAGKHYQVQGLQDIESFISPYGCLYLLDDRRVLLGGSIEDNIRELQRKLGLFKKVKLNGSSSIEAEYSQFIKSLGHEVFYFSNFLNLNESLFASAPESLQQIHAELIELLQGRQGSQKKLIAQQLLMSVQIHAQPYMSDSFDSMRLWWLSLRLIMPLFKLNHLELYKILKSEYLEISGHFKSTSIDEWLFVQNKFKAICLSSLEGMVKSNQVIMAGNSNIALPFKLANKYRELHGVSFMLEYPANAFEINNSCLIVYTSNEKMGTDAPFILLDVQDAKNILCSFAAPTKKGSKDEFYLTQAKDEILSCILKIFPRVEKDVILYCLKENGRYGHWVERFTHKGKSYFQGLFGGKQREPMSLCLLENDKPVDGLSYWGSQRVVHHGLLDYLLEFRQQDEHKLK